MYILSSLNFVEVNYVPAFQEFELALEMNVVTRALTLLLASEVGVQQREYDALPYVKDVGE